VEINGYKVGVVRSLDFIDVESGRLLVKFSVKKGFKIPKNTVAEIVLFHCRRNESSVRIWQRPWYI